MGSVCGMLNKSKSNINSLQTDFQSRHDAELNNLLYSSYFHRVAACGLCAIYRFYKLGVESYKIVGRSENPDGIIEDVKMVRDNLKIAETCSSEQEYLEKMILPKNSRVSCKMGLGCYYPEIRF